MVENEKIIERIDAYEYLKKAPYGNLAILEIQIGEECVNHFKNDGIISCGLNSSADKRYQVTSNGKEIIEIELRSLYWKLVDLKMV